MDNIFNHMFKVAYAIRSVSDKKPKRLPCKVYSKEEITEINKRIVKTVSDIKILADAINDKKQD